MINTLDLPFCTAIHATAHLEPGFDTGNSKHLISISHRLNGNLVILLMMVGWVWGREQGDTCLQGMATDTVICQVSGWKFPSVRVQGEICYRSAARTGLDDSMFCSLGILHG